MVIFPFGILNEKKSSGNYNSCHCINDNWIHCIHFLTFLGLLLLSFSLLYITAIPAISSTNEKIATIYRIKEIYFVFSSSTTNTEFLSILIFFL